jgi:hypothetical protein
MKKDEELKPPPYKTIEPLSIEPPKHRIKITDQIHLNPAYLHHENNDEQQTEKLWIQQTKF